MCLLRVSMGNVKDGSNRYRDEQASSEWPMPTGWSVSKEMKLLLPEPVTPMSTITTSSILIT
jgi:hypothetical protein